MLDKMFTILSKTLHAYQHVEMYSNALILFIQGVIHKSTGPTTITTKIIYKKEEEFL